MQNNYINKEAIDMKVRAISRLLTAAARGARSGFGPVSNGLPTVATLSYIAREPTYLRYTMTGVI